MLKEFSRYIKTKIFSEGEFSNKFKILLNLFISSITKKIDYFFYIKNETIKIKFLIK